MRGHFVGGGAALVCLGFGLACCVGDAPSQPDAGADAAGESSAMDVGVTDAPPADAGADGITRACDPKKNFASPMAVTLQNDVNPISVQSFKVRGGHVYVSRVGQAGVEQGTLANRAITFPGLLSVFASTVQSGVDVSPDELSMVYSIGGALVRVSRATTTDTFKMPVVLTIPLPPVDASLDVQLAVTGTAAQLLFTRVENSAGPQSVQIFEARLVPDGGADVYTASKQTTLPSQGIPYVSRPVRLGENTLYLTGWGTQTGQHQRILGTTRPNTTTPWGAPTLVTIDGFTPKASDDVVPLDVSEDDCVLYLGVSSLGVDGPYSVYEARRPQ